MTILIFIASAWCLGAVVVYSLSHVDSLWPHELQHTRLPCPPLAPRVCSNSCPLTRWCYLTISSSAHPLLLLPSVFPSNRVFSNESALHIRWPKYSSSVSASVLPMNIQGWFPPGLTGLILLSKGLSIVFSSTTIWKHKFFGPQPPLWYSSHICIWLLEKS